MLCRLVWQNAVVAWLVLASVAPTGELGQGLRGQPEGRVILAVAEKNRYKRPKGVIGLGFSSDGRELCLQEYSGEGLKTTLIAINLGSGEQRRGAPPLRFPEFLAGRPAPLVPDQAKLLFFLPDGKHYITSAGSFKEGASVQLRDVGDGTCLREFHRRKAPLGTYFLSGDGKMLASAEAGGLVKVSNVDSGKELAELKGGDQRAVTAIAFHPTRGQVATVVGDFVQVWELKSAKAVRKLEFATRAQGVAYSPNGKWLAVATDLASGKSPEIIFLDASTFEKVASVKRERECGAVGIVFNPTGTLIAAGPRGNLIQVWEVSEKAERPWPAKKDSPK